MIVIKAITIGLLLVASESVANICTGRWNGDQLPNPSDCGSFYVCNHGEPKLFKCLENLLYDPIKRVCNWAYLVTCGQPGTQEHVPVLPNPPYYPQNPPQGQPEIETPQGQPEIETQHPIYPGTPQYETQPPFYPTNQPQYPTNQPQYPTNAPSYTYTAHPPPMIEDPNIPDYSEADEFYPGLVESIPNVFHCTNPEFYFAPHPRSCEKYFICENYRIHLHQCGEGIHWDYVFNQCDFPVKTFCYSGISVNHPVHIIDETEQHIIDEMEHIEENHEGTTIGVTGPIAIASIEPIVPTAAPVPDTVVCPGTQAFIGHPGDCQKYFICIGGIPIVTSCPNLMAWDKDLSQCNELAWSECFG